MSRAVPLPMRFTVVSKPAASSSIAVAVSSSWVSLPSALWACPGAEGMWWPGGGGAAPPPPPGEELAAHRDRRAEHLGDDRGGEQARVLGHQVDVAAAF